MKTTPSIPAQGTPTATQTGETERHTPGPYTKAMRFILDEELSPLQALKDADAEITEALRTFENRSLKANARARFASIRDDIRLAIQRATQGEQT